ncbi:hypothetical protein [Rhodovulum sp. PH10]|uniref:hypothetical protein n=1 Tax=Rhodovulum sp. PH10 TaxID=1187851 RepID=UPI00178C5CF1|nr:hypothetical protein [Rhodovulum sp. PH10]
MPGSFDGPVRAAFALTAVLALAGCGGGFNLPSFSGPSQPEAPPPPEPAPPSSIPPENLVGRWGLAAYHRPEDRARTESAARSQCGNPYVINRSSIGVAMLGHDDPKVQDMFVKGSHDGKSYIGPSPQSGDADDREVVSFDGRVLVLKWVDPEVAGRYGIQVLVRCGAEGTATRSSRAAPPRPPARQPAPAAATPVPATPR